MTVKSTKAQNSSKKHEKSNQPQKTTDEKRETRPMPLMRAFHDTLDWVLDIAVNRVSHSDDIAAVERVRDALRARISGRYSPLSIEDLLFATDLIVSAMDSDMHPTSRDQLIAC